MICGRTSLVRMQSRFRTWSLIRPWVVNLRCVSGTSGGAWVGVVQALAGCGESVVDFQCRRIEFV